MKVRDMKLKKEKEKERPLTVTESDSLHIMIIWIDLLDWENNYFNQFKYIMINHVIH